MEQDYQLITFSFEGKSNIEGEANFEYLEDRVLKPTNKTDNFKSVIVNELNNEAAKISDEITKEIRKTFPPGFEITTQTYIQFSKGSIILDGTIILLNWLGPVIFPTVKSEIEKQLKNLVKIVIQNVCSKYIFDAGKRALESIKAYLENPAKAITDSKIVQPTPYIGALKVHRMDVSYSGTTHQISEQILEQPKASSDSSIRKSDIWLGMAIGTLAILQIFTLVQLVDVRLEPKIKNIQPTSPVSPTP